VRIAARTPPPRFWMSDLLGVRDGRVGKQQSDTLASYAVEAPARKGVVVPYARPPRSCGKEPCERSRSGQRSTLERTLLGAILTARTRWMTLPLWMP